MLWVVIAIAVIAVILMVKGGSWYFKEDSSIEYAPTKRKGLYYIVVGASLIMSLAAWNEFYYKRSQTSLEREEKRLAAICTDVVKAYNRSKEPIEATMTDMKLVQFPFLPRAASKAIGDCQFSIIATVEATYRKGGTHPKTYEALVEFDPAQESWHLRNVKWLDE